MQRVFLLPVTLSGMLLFLERARRNIYTDARLDLSLSLYRRDAEQYSARARLRASLSVLIACGIRILFVLFALPVYGIRGYLCGLLIVRPSWLSSIGILARQAF